MHNLLLNVGILPNRRQKQYYIINTTSVILSIKQYLSLLNGGLPNEKHYKQNSFFKTSLSFKVKPTNACIYKPANIHGGTSNVTTKVSLRLKMVYKQNKKSVNSVRSGCAY